MDDLFLPVSDPPLTLPPPPPHPQLQTEGGITTVSDIPLTLQRVRTLASNTPLTFPLQAVGGTTTASNLTLTSDPHMLNRRWHHYSVRHISDPDSHTPKQRMTSLQCQTYFWPWLPHSKTKDDITAVSNIPLTPTPTPQNKGWHHYSVRHISDLDSHTPKQRMTSLQCQTHHWPWLPLTLPAEDDFTTMSSGPLTLTSSHTLQAQDDLTTGFFFFLLNLFNCLWQLTQSMFTSSICFQRWWSWSHLLHKASLKTQHGTCLRTSANRPVISV